MDEDGKQESREMFEKILNGETSAEQVNHGLMMQQFIQYFVLQIWNQQNNESKKGIINNWMTFRRGILDQVYAQMAVEGEDFDGMDGFRQEYEESFIKNVLGVNL
jgi:hypothetical protein